MDPFFKKSNIEVEKINNTKRCYPNPILLQETYFWKNQVNFSHSKMIWKIRIEPFLSPPHSPISKISIFFKPDQFWAKNTLILYANYWYPNRPISYNQSHASYLTSRTNDLALLVERRQLVLSLFRDWQQRGQKGGRPTKNDDVHHHFFRPSAPSFQQ